MPKFYTTIKNRLLNTSEDNKSIIKNTIGAFLVKGGGLLISLFKMPAYMKYFDNQEVLGLWFTILSVLSWILSFDLGIGNGLRNKLVPVIVKKDKYQTKKYISSSYFSVGAVVVFSIATSTIIFRYIDWNTFFNISEDLVTKSTLNITVNIVFSGIMIQFLLKLITSVLYAMQKSALTSFLNLLSSLITLVYVTVAKSSSISTNLISLALLHVLAVNLPLLLATIIVFVKELKGCRPEPKYFDIKYAKSVMKLGGAFFWVQIMYMIITATNEFAISWFTSPDMVVEYQIYNKIFTLVGTVFTLALTPIWSAVTKALSENNYTWIKKIYKVLKYMALLAVVCEFAIIPFLQFGINLWLGENAIEVNYLYAITFVIYGSMIIWNGVISSIANGVGKLKTQNICFTIGAVIKIPIAWLLVNMLNSWIGVILSNIAAMSLYCIIQPIKINKFLNKKELEGNDDV